jgi:hypothetical protein
VSRVVKFGDKWVVAYRRGDCYIIPAHTGVKDAPLAYVGTLEEFAQFGYLYARQGDAVKRATEIYPFHNTAFERKAA